MSAPKQSGKKRGRRLFLRADRIYAKIKLPDGTWKDYATGLSRGQEGDAEALRQSMQREVDRGAVLGLQPGQGGTTLSAFYGWWIERRKARGLRAWKDDKSRIETHVLEDLGHKLLAEITPIDLELVFQSMRGRGKAPKTVWNVYSAVRALFRDAAKKGFVPQSPCVLGEEELGPMVDKDPEWRDGALYTRSELESLMFDLRVPVDRRVYYATAYLSGRRLGEVSGLRVRHLVLGGAPLGSMLVARSYERGPTKTDQTVKMPIHPVLGRILTWWLNVGFALMFGREPGPDDFVIPRPPEAKSKHGASRDKNFVRKQLMKDLEVLDLRHRRTHDLRRSFISYTQEDGGDANVLMSLTHPSTKKATSFAGYTTVPWTRACAEVAKLRVEVPEETVAAMRLAVGAGVEVDHDPDPDDDPSPDRPRMPVLRVLPSLQSHSRARLAAVLAAPKEKALELPGLRSWRRRESNPGPRVR